MRKLATLVCSTALALMFGAIFGSTFGSQPSFAQRSGGGGMRAGGAISGGGMSGGGAMASGARAGANPGRFAIPSAGLGGRAISRADLTAFRKFYRNGPYGDLLSSLGVLSDFSGDGSAYGYGSGAPNVFLMPSAPAAGMMDEPQTSVQPLMIELRDGHYVRVASDSETPQPTARAIPPQPASPRSDRAMAAHAGAVTMEVGRQESGRAEAGRTDAAVHAARDLPPAVLIFRDGHTENVRDYAIADGNLYARGDFYTDGYWTRTIELARLNLAATIASNADHGVKFVLPSAPNEVVTRP